jgi:Domain of unknown function (DUF4062)
MIAIRTPDQRLRIFISSTMKELAGARVAARTAIERLRLIPVLFELGARPYPPRDLYLAYLRQTTRDRSPSTGVSSTRLERWVSSACFRPHHERSLRLLWPGALGGGMISHCRRGPHPLELGKRRQPLRGEAMPPTS